MDAKQFDLLVRSLPHSISRRSLVTALPGVALAATARLGAGPASAGPRQKSCGNGKKRCGGKCTDTATNPNHCGRCGRQCQGRTRCHAGACLPRCDTVLTAAGCEPGPAGQWICRTVDFGGAALGGCDLSVAQFHGVDLSGVDLSGTNLTGALFVGSLLTGADLSGANLTGVNWGRMTTCPDGANVGVVDDTCCGHLNGAVPATGC